MQFFSRYNNRHTVHNAAHHSVRVINFANYVSGAKCCVWTTHPRLSRLSAMQHVDTCEMRIIRDKGKQDYQRARYKVTEKHLTKYRVRLLNIPNCFWPQQQTDHFVRVSFSSFKMLQPNASSCHSVTQPSLDTSAFAGNSSKSHL